MNIYTTSDNRFTFLEGKGVIIDNDTQDRYEAGAWTLEDWQEFCTDGHDRVAHVEQLSNLDDFGPVYNVVFTYSFSISAADEDVALDLAADEFIGDIASMTPDQLLDIMGVVVEEEVIA
jgi:hypothetical protein